MNTYIHRGRRVEPRTDRHETSSLPPAGGAAAQHKDDKDDETSCPDEDVRREDKDIKVSAEQTNVCMGQVEREQPHTKQPQPGQLQRSANNTTWATPLGA